MSSRCGGGARSSLYSLPRAPVAGARQPSWQGGPGGSVQRIRVWHMVAPTACAPPPQGTASDTASVIAPVTAPVPTPGRCRCLWTPSPATLRNGLVVNTQSHRLPGKWSITCQKKQERFFSGHRSVATFRRQSSSANLCARCTSSKAPEKHGPLYLERDMHRRPGPFGRQNARCRAVHWRSRLVFSPTPRRPLPALKF